MERRFSGNFEIQNLCSFFLATALKRFTSVNHTAAINPSSLPPSSSSRSTIIVIMTSSFSGSAGGNVPTYLPGKTVDDGDSSNYHLATATAGQQHHAANPTPDPWNSINNHNHTTATLLPTLTGLYVRSFLGVTLALYILNQKHLLPLPLSRVVSKALFWPTLPLTYLKRRNQWYSRIDDTVLMGAAPFGFAGIPQQLYEQYNVSQNSRIFWVTKKSRRSCSVVYCILLHCKSDFFLTTMNDLYFHHIIRYAGSSTCAKNTGDPPSSTNNSVFKNCTCPRPIISSPASTTYSEPSNSFNTINNTGTASMSIVGRGMDDRPPPSFVIYSPKIPMRVAKS